MSGTKRTPKVRLQNHWWAIVSTETNTVLHTNWMLGVGRVAWSGMAPVVLFTTREDARKALKSLTDRLPLPFEWRIAKVSLVATAEGK